MLPNAPKHIFTYSGNYFCTYYNHLLWTILNMVVHDGGSVQGLLKILRRCYRYHYIINHNLSNMFWAFINYLGVLQFVLKFQNMGWVLRGPVVTPSPMFGWKPKFTTSLTKLHWPTLEKKLFLCLVWMLRLKKTGLSSFQTSFVKPLELTNLFCCPILSECWYFKWMN